MNEHKKINKMLTSFALGELSEQQVAQVKSHLAECSLCSIELKRLQSLLNCTEQISKISVDKQICLAAENDILETIENKKITTPLHNTGQENIWINIMKNPVTKIAVAASFLVFVSFVISFILYGKVIDLRNKLELAQKNTANTLIDDSVTINLYIKEHQDTIARQASLNSITPQPAQISVSQSDVMYYELLDDQSEFMSPGIIVKGPSFERQAGLPETPVISNGHTLTLSEARDAADFDIVSPSWFHPCYMLSQLRIIEDHDAVQLLYTDGINSISLFEQPLDGQRGLSHNDFREYAVYNNQEEGGGTILAWRDDTLSYVLIGNTELSQLMDMAQSINAGK